MANSLSRAPHRPLLPAGYDGGGLDFYFRLALHEGNDLYDAHHGEIPSHHGPVRRADIRELRMIFVAARDIPSQPYDVFRAGLCLRGHGANVLERLPHMVGQALAVETTLASPPHPRAHSTRPSG